MSHDQIVRVERSATPPNNDNDIILSDTHTDEQLTTVTTVPLKSMSMCLHDGSIYACHWLGPPSSGLVALAGHESGGGSFSTVLAVFSRDATLYEL